MNAIVSLYKNFILTLLFIGLTGAFLAGLLVTTSADMPGSQRLLTLFGILGGAFLMFLLVAWSAVILSIHDRHNEIAEGVHRIADALENAAIGGENNAG